MKPLRVLVVDDEPLAREHAASMLADLPGFEVVAEAAGGSTAIALIREHQPDLVLLDIQMPEVSGFDVLQALAPDELPFVVFMTAYDEFALRAFRVNALDYLVKPVEPRVFAEAMARVQSLVAGPAERAERRRLLRLLAELREEEPPPDRLVVRWRDRVLFLSPQEVDWIEAAGNYARLHRGDRAFLIRRTMASLEESLPPRSFARIQRSVIINVERLVELRHEGKDDYVVVLRGGHELRLSPRYREALEQVLGEF